MESSGDSLEDEARKGEEKKKTSKERTRKYRAKKSQAEKDNLKEKDKMKKAKERNEMSPEEKKVLLEKRRANYARKVAEKKENERKEKFRNSYFYNQNMHDKERIRKKRKERSIEEVEFDCVEQLIRRRKARENRDDEKHIEDNLKAKIGMQELKSMCRIMPFKKRYFHKKSEMDIWMIFHNLGPSYKDLLEKRRPDIFKVLEEIMIKDEEDRNRVKEKEMRKKTEELKKERELKNAIEEAVRQGNVGTGTNEGYANVEGEWHWAGDPDKDPEKPKGEWVYNAEYDDYTWVGEGDPPQDEPFDSSKNNWNITEEDEKRFREQEESWLRHEIDKMREDRKEYMKNYHKKKKAELLEPIVMDSYGEMSEYERLREDNIRQFEELKEASGLFD